MPHLFVVVTREMCNPSDLPRSAYVSLLAELLFRCCISLACIPLPHLGVLRCCISASCIPLLHLGIMCPKWTLCGAVDARANTRPNPMHIFSQAGSCRRAPRTFYSTSQVCSLHTCTVYVYVHLTYRHAHTQACSHTGVHLGQSTYRHSRASHIWLCILYVGVHLIRRRVSHIWACISHMGMHLSYGRASHMVASRGGSGAPFSTTTQPQHQK